MILVAFAQMKQASMRRRKLPVLPVLYNPKQTANNRRMSKPHYFKPEPNKAYIVALKYPTPTRLNEGNVARHTMQRLDSFVDAVVGKRITYAEVTA